MQTVDMIKITTTMIVIMMMIVLRVGDSIVDEFRWWRFSMKTAIFSDIGGFLFAAENWQKSYPDRERLIKWASIIIMVHKESRFPVVFTFVCSMRNIYVSEKNIVRRSKESLIRFNNHLESIRMY